MSSLTTDFLAILIAIGREAARATQGHPPGAVVICDATPTLTEMLRTLRDCVWAAGPTEHAMMLEAIEGAAIFRAILCEAQGCDMVAAAMELDMRRAAEGA